MGTILLRDKHSGYLVVGKHRQTTEDYYIMEIAGCYQMFSLKDWEHVELKLKEEERGLKWDEVQE